MVDTPEQYEYKRLAALNDYGELDNVLKLEFDSAVRLVSGICRVPAAYITFIDGDKQWVKSQKGIAMIEIPRVFLSAI